MWLPHVTVATILEQDNRYLLVLEETPEGQRYNQPAGHLEEHESLQQAAIRETYEETGWHVDIKHLIGVSLYHSPHNGLTYVRVTFKAECVRHDREARLDEGIIKPEWLTYEEISERRESLRSPCVLHDIELARSGAHFGLELLSHFPLK